MDHPAVRAWLIVAAAFALMVGCSSVFAAGIVANGPGGSSWQMHWHGTPNAGVAEPYATPIEAATARCIQVYGNPASCDGTPVVRSQNPAGCMTGAVYPGTCSVQVSPEDDAAGSWDRGTYSATLHWHSVPTPGSCPANSTDNSGTCYCNAGYRPVANVSTGAFDTCGTYTCESGFTTVHQDTYGPYPSKPVMGEKIVCEDLGENGSSMQGCASKQYTTFAAQGADGWYAELSRVTTGEQCNSDTGTGTDAEDASEAEDEENEAELQCSGGKVPGTVNGTPVCVEPGQATEQTKTTKNPDGTTTTETTTCSGEVCTTVKVTKDSSGNVTSTTTTSTGKGTFCAENPGATTCGGSGTGGTGSGGGGFCEENPELAICGDSTFAGSCPSFVCEGDAVQCAIAKEQHIRNCRLFDSETSPSQLSSFGQGQLVEDAGQLGAPGQPMEGVAGTPGNPHKVNVGAMFSSMPANPFNETCPPDQTIVLAGKTFSIPLASACTSLQVLGYIAVAFTLVMCSMWLVRAGDK